MKIKITHIFLIFSLLLCFGCQKLDLQNDGYFILKPNGKRITFNKCSFNTFVDNSGSTPIYRTEIIAYNKSKSNDTIHPQIMLYFPGNTTGTFFTFDPLNPSNLLAIIHYNNNTYEYPSFGGAAEININIEKFDTKDKKIKGTLSGKFYASSNDYIDVKSSDFCAKY